MDITYRLYEAGTVAQHAFHEMLEARCYSDPDDPRTRAYVAAERLVDELLVEAQWEKAKAELDRLQAIDIEELAKGDHFAGMPR